MFRHAMLKLIVMWRQVSRLATGGCLTRNGEIARLPVEVRNELNRRLEDGQHVTSWVDWRKCQHPVPHSVQIDEVRDWVRDWVFRGIYTYS